MIRALGILSFVAAIAYCYASAPAASLITLDVRDVDITDAIALLAAESGVNIVTDGSVKPERVTVHLTDVTFAQALAAITGAHGLRVRHEGGVLVVGAAESVNREGDGVVITLERAQPDDVAREIAPALPEGTVIVPDKRTSSLVVSGDTGTIAKARRLIAMLDVAPASSAQSSSTNAYRLRFLKPDDVVAKLKTIAPDGIFVADEEQNAVLVTGGERAQGAAAAIVAQLDRPSAQVLFEVRVADVTPVNDSSNFGIEFGGVDAQGNSLPGAVAYAFAGGTINVNVQLNALVSKGRASILATPKLVTINNKEADLSIGETYPIVYSTSVFGGQNVQYVDIGVHLRLTPTIGSDGSVIAELHPEYSELVGFTPTGYPIVANRKIDSTLHVRDNETIVLGGLMRETSTETISKIPGLADIPILGKLFQNKQSTHERDEIVFLITPHVVYPGSPLPVR
jgi:type II secretory pathway component GspD/PulD (secretin)